MWRWMVAGIVALGAVAALETGMVEMQGRRELPAAEAGTGPGQRYLIINADDFGLTDGVTEGIVRAWRDGVLTSTSAMINIDGAPERIARAHRDNPGLPIGLHLNITTGRPVLPPEQVPSLVGPDGRLYEAEEVMAHLPFMSHDEVRKETRAQAEHLLAAGVRFDHIDSHHNILALYTPLFAVVRELAKEYGVPVRQPVPGSAAGDGIKVQGKGGGGESVVALLGFALRHPFTAMRMMGSVTPAAFKRQAKLLRREGIPTTDWFIDRYYGNASVANFIAIVRQLPAGTSEMMVHPAVVDDDLRQWGGSYVEPRATELEVLIDPAVRDELKAAGVETIDFSARRRQQEAG